MNKLDIEMLATKLFSEVNTYVNRYMGDMKKYVDKSIEEAITSAKASVHGDSQQQSDAQPETIKSLERRASRHAEHLRALEDRVKALEHGGR